MRQRRAASLDAARRHPHAARRSARLPPDLVVAGRRSEGALARERRGAPGRRRRAGHPRHDLLHDRSAQEVARPATPASCSGSTTPASASRSRSWSPTRDCVVETAINADAGALGTVVKNRLLVNLKDPKRGHLPYYAAPVERQLPRRAGHGRRPPARRALRRSRPATRPFTEREELLVQDAAEQMLRGIQSERVFAAVERAKYEHERFFAALARLNRALTAEDVYATTFEATREICDFDFAAITLFDKSAKRHTVVSAVGDAPQGPGRPVVRRQRRPRVDGGQEQALPARRRRDPRQGRARLHQEGAPRRHGVAAGAAAHLRATRRSARSPSPPSARAPSARTSARCSPSSPTTSRVSLANAQLYGRMEEMATTDGLTGLVNHRTFQERFAEMLARAERTGGRHALLLTDIDHFKKVNDTYGHPIGDVVLRGVAARRARLRAQDRPGGALRRRRVRHRPRGHRSRRRAHARRAHPRRGAEAGVPVGEGPVRLHAVARHRRLSRRRQGRQDASSITPTSRSITPSTTAETAPSPGPICNRARSSSKPSSSAR